MLLAVILDRDMRGQPSLPDRVLHAGGAVAGLIGFIWQLFYSRDQGLINQVFNSEIDWYGDPNVNLWAVLVATSWRHTGYIMLIYLAGLKGVDGTLREAAAVDGASEARTFFHVIFPVMRPINMIVLVIVVIESLRAFDLVWVVNKGRNGLGDHRGPGQPERDRRGHPVRVRLRARGDHDADLLGVHHHLPPHRLPRGA